MITALWITLAAALGAALPVAGQGGGSFADAGNAAFGAESRARPPLAEAAAQPGEDDDDFADGGDRVEAAVPRAPVQIAPGAAASGAAQAVASEEEGEDDDDKPTDELAAAKAAEAQALADDARQLHERQALIEDLAPGNPLRDRVQDLPDSLPEVEADARESRQIARELDQFETFDASAAAGQYDIPVELNDQVSQYIRMFQGPLRSHFTVWLERASRYVPRMRALLAQEGVPEDTVFLSLIESGFSTLAYSVARAAGQWQFIAPTGRRFGLRSDFWVDERRDPEKATVAAARYLKELRGQLGSWYLAWAGYNAGAGTISKAIRRAHSNDFWTLMRGRVLRKETKGYVPKLIAAALISKHPRAFGFGDLTFEDLPAADVVQVAEPTELAFLAAAAGTDVQTLRDLNPALRRFCTPPSTGGQGQRPGSGQADRPGYPIRVPAGSAERVQAALASRQAGERLRLRYHKVQPGEGLGAVARQFGVAPESIARLNGLHRQAVKPGRELVVALPAARPVADALPACDLRVAEVSDERERESPKRRGRRQRWRRGSSGWRAADDCQDPFAPGAGDGLVLEPEPPAPPPRPKLASSSKVAAPSSGGSYVLRDGDNLWEVAKRLGLKFGDLERWNHLDDDSVLHPGQVIRLGE